MSARWDRAAAAVAVVLGLLLVVGASARRPLDGGAAAPALPAWPLLFVVGAGLVMSAALAFSVLAPLAQVRPGRPGRTGLRAGPLTLGFSILLPAAIIAIYAAPGTSGPHKTIAPLPNFATHGPRQPKPAKPGADQGSGIAALAAGIAAGVVGASRTGSRAPRWPRAPATPRPPPPSRPTPAPPCWQPTRAWRQPLPASASPGARATPRASTSRGWRSASAEAARRPRG
jgi:hypothetical protein